MCTFVHAVQSLYVTIVLKLFYLHFHFHFLYPIQGQFICLCVRLCTTYFTLSLSPPLFFVIWAWYPCLWIYSKESRSTTSVHCLNFVWCNYVKREGMRRELDRNEIEIGWKLDKKWRYAGCWGRGRLMGWTLQCATRISLCVKRLKRILQSQRIRDGEIKITRG